MSETNASNWRGRLLGMAADFALTAAVVGVCLFGYDRLVVQPARRIGIVDVGEVMRAKEREFTEALTKAGSTEADRSRVVASAGDFAKALPAALDAVSAECNCLVLVRGAVVSEPGVAVDLTGSVKRKVGLVN